MRMGSKASAFTLAKVELSRLGVVMRRTGQGDELRVNIVGGTEATAYYTDDLDDARNTGILMAHRNGGTVQ
jgi:hypothetical protein